MDDSNPYSLANLRRTMTIGFEATFTIPNWWQSPGFCAAMGTEDQIAYLRRLSGTLRARIGGTAEETIDRFQAPQIQHYDASGAPTYRIECEPGCLEVVTPAALYDDLGAMLEPLFAAAEEAGMVTYRSWWYGWRSGTTGGFHLNLGAREFADSAWKRDPVLLAKYLAFYHAHPELHYPFTGVDVGRGGNAMRLDEFEEDDRASFRRMDALLADLSSGSLDASLANGGFDILRHFAGTAFAKLKYASNSIRKMRDPLWILEDRAIEMAPDAAAAMRLADLRLRILAKVAAEPVPARLVDFGEAARTTLISSAGLWRRFAALAAELGLAAADFRFFFDRQFPRLAYGDPLPERFELREGRRPRVYEGEGESRAGVVLTRRIDSRYKRLEFHLPAGAAERGHRLRMQGEVFHPGPDGVLLDFRAPFANERSAPVRLEIEVLDGEGRQLEYRCFDPNAMGFVAGTPRVGETRRENRDEGGYYSRDADADWAVGI